MASAAPVEIQLHISGPVFDGRAKAAVRLYLDAATMAVAEVGVNEVHQLQHVYKHPTGYYASKIVTNRASTEAAGAIVYDSGVIYGPWLEGLGSRNKTTRFKGYRTFRIATQQLQKKAGPIAFGVLDQFVARMN